MHDLEIVQWWEEVDQSGAKLERPMFQQALARCEAGESEGIIVARLDRFARSAIDALSSIKRLNAAKARLVSVEDNFDGSTAMGRFAIGILTLIAELELERITESWRVANEEAVARGVHVSARPPAGYLRDESGRLQPDPNAVGAIRQVFQRRATGTSYRELAAYLDSQGVGPSTGNPHWSSQGVAGLLKNRVYLGEARAGTITNREAHEPIVGTADFEAAQLAHTVHASRDGSLSEKALLTGLLRCAGCGHTLKVAGTTDRKSGQRSPSYYCSKRFATGVCPAPASARAATIDPYVEQQVLELLRSEAGLIAEAHKAQQQLEQLHQAVTDAEQELVWFLNQTTIRETVGDTVYLQTVQTRQTSVDEARVALTQQRAQATAIANVTDGNLLEAWSTLTIPEKRQLLHGLLDRVELTDAGGKRGRAAPPIERRTRIVVRGTAVAALPT
jgi:DNA invertase Pin-like site-specific DNA recombinase